MKILLMGNPNVGKSVIFNQLTGLNIMVSNYPGTTVDYTKGYLKLNGEEIEVIDVPGTFSLKPKNKAEEVAVKLLEENRDSIVICVVDSAKLTRALYLILEIIEEGYPVIIALNMRDIARKKGIRIDYRKLERILGVPVVCTIAVRGEGIKELKSRIKEAKSADIMEIVRKQEV